MVLRSEWVHCRRWESSQAASERGRARQGVADVPPETVPIALAGNA